MSNDSGYRILHLADPHFTYCHYQDGTPAEIGRQCAAEILTVLNQFRLYQEPLDCIILSGDFTYGCNKKGFQAAEAFIKAMSHWTEPRNSIVVVPGNHDVTLKKSIKIEKLYLPPSPEEASEEYRGFLDRIRKYVSPASEWLVSSHKVQRPNLPALFIQGLNSCRMERRDAMGWGFIGGDQLYQLGDTLVNGPEKQRPGEDDIVLAVTHHNPLPIWDIGVENTKKPLIGRKFSFMMDAAGLLEFLSDMEVAVLLHGHTHTRSNKRVLGYFKAHQKPFELVVMGAGSCAIRRTGLDAPAHHFQILEFNHDGDGWTLQYTDVESDEIKPNGVRLWKEPTGGTIHLMSKWDRDKAEKALELRELDQYGEDRYDDVANSWATLRARKLDPDNWGAVLSGIYGRTAKAAARFGITDLKQSEIDNVVEDFFKHPPLERELCQYRLEEMILRRWGNK